MGCPCDAGARYLDGGASGGQHMTDHALAFNTLRAPLNPPRPSFRSELGKSLKESQRSSSPFSPFALHINLAPHPRHLHQQLRMNRANYDRNVLTITELEAKGSAKLPKPVRGALSVLHVHRVTEN